MAPETPTSSDLIASDLFSPEFASLIHTNKEFLQWCLMLSDVLGCLSCRYIITPEQLTFVVRRTESLCGRNQETGHVK